MSTKLEIFREFLDRAWVGCDEIVAMIPIIHHFRYKLRLGLAIG
jgi:hypothetical protein